MNGWKVFGIVVIVLVVLGLVGGGGYVAYDKISAEKKDSEEKIAALTKKFEDLGKKDTTPDSGKPADPKVDPKSAKVDPKIDPKADPKADPTPDPKVDPKSAKVDPKIDPKADPKKKSPFARKSDVKDVLDVIGKLTKVIENGQEETREGFKKVDKRFDSVDEQLGGMKKDIAVLKTDVGVLKTDMTSVKKDVATLKGDVAKIKSDMGKLAAEFELVLKDDNRRKAEVAELDTPPPLGKKKFVRAATEEGDSEFVSYRPRFYRYCAPGCAPAYFMNYGGSWYCWNSCQCSYYSGAYYQNCWMNWNCF